VCAAKFINQTMTYNILLFAILLLFVQQTFHLKFINQTMIYSILLSATLLLLYSVQQTLHLNFINQTMIYSYSILLFATLLLLLLTTLCAVNVKVHKSNNDISLFSTLLLLFNVQQTLPLKFINQRMIYYYCLQRCCSCFMCNKRYV
jgi:hypothetical protein